MKIVVIGDIHGRDFWKNLNVDNYDKIIFVGDYTDSYVFPNPTILKNLLEIVQLKKDNPDKVELLLGNHDIQYAFPHERSFITDGLRPEAIHDLYSIFNNSRDLFNVAFQRNNFIVTHAGITNGWFKHNENTINEAKDLFETETLADTLNHMLWVEKYNLILHQIGHKRKGYYDWGGITWADMSETTIDALDGYEQAVGHTPVDYITTIIKKNNKITYCDVLGTSEPIFFEVDIN